MADAMRKYKNRLRTTYLDPHTTHEVRLNNRPPGVRPEDWAAFVEHNADPKTIEQRRKNMNVRKKLNIYHTSGRYGHARLQQKLKEDDPLLTRAEVWIEAHKRKDSSIPSSLSSHVERIQELLSSQEVGSHDILNDPLTKVFGADTRGRVRGVGNNVSRTQIVSSAPALEKLAAKEKNVNGQSGEIKDLKDEVKHLRSELGGIKQLIEATVVNIVVGSLAWVEDDMAWIDGKVLHVSGEEIKIICTNEKGAYGEIYLVKWRGTNVAAKTIHPSIASNSEVKGSYLRRYINTSYIVDFGDTK